MIALEDYELEGLTTATNIARVCRDADRAQRALSETVALAAAEYRLNQLKSSLENCPAEVWDLSRHCLAAGIDYSQEEESLFSMGNRLYSRFKRGVTDLYRTIRSVIDFMWLRLLKAKNILNESPAYARIIEKGTAPVIVNIFQDHDVYYSQGKISFSSTITHYQEALARFLQTLQEFDDFLKRETLSHFEIQEFINGLAIVNLPVANRLLVSNKGKLFFRTARYEDYPDETLSIPATEIVAVDAELAKLHQAVSQVVKNRSGQLSEFETALTTRAHPIKEWEAIELLLGARKFLELELLRVIGLNVCTMVGNLAAGYNRLVEKKIRVSKMLTGGFNPYG
jgi:hypothetical protein